MASMWESMAELVKELNVNVAEVDVTNNPGWNLLWNKFCSKYSVSHCMPMSMYIRKKSVVHATGYHYS